MKISVVTITRNDGPLLARTISSIYAQKLPPGVELEYVIVDGCSDTPQTEAILAEAEARGSRVIRREPRGCYNAINQGIEACTGDVIGLLHGTDFYADSQAVADICNAFSDKNTGFIFADIVYASPESDIGRIHSTRRYSSEKFSPDSLRHGFAPPHPTLYVRADLMREIGPYREDYIISADFEYFVRLFMRSPQPKWRRLDRVLVAMDNAGASASWKNRLTVNVPEKMKALRTNGLRASWFNMLLRYYYHFSQK